MNTYSDSTFDSTPIRSEQPRGVHTLWGLILGFGYLTLLPALAYGAMYTITGNFPGIEISAQIITGIGVLLFYVLILGDKVELMIGSITKNDWKTALQYAGLMYVAGVIWSYIQFAISGNVTSNENQQALQTYVLTAPVNLGILTMIIAPLLEEMIFRYFIFGSLRKYNVYLGFFLSITLFAGIHFLASLSAGTLSEDLITMPPYLLSAGFLTFVYYKTNRIGVPILTHFVYNSFAFMLMMILG